MKRQVCLLGIFGMAMVAVASAQDAVVSSSLSEADQLQFRVQGICPVSGEELGSMGDPVKVKIDGQDVFLCCKDCRGKPADPKQWKTIQANLAKAQGTCPISGEPVTADSKSMLVNGREVFVCCPSCIEKVTRDPDKTLAKIDESYGKYLAEAARDRARIAAQGICPVSGKKLGSMGEPVKSKIGDEEVFLCCEGCKGLAADPDHWKTVLANLKKAQETCPVSGESLPDEAQSIVVDGRRVFVCCADCIKTVKADSSTYVNKLDELYAKSAKDNVEKSKK